VNAFAARRHRRRAGGAVVASVPWGAHLPARMECVDRFEYPEPV